MWIITYNFSANLISVEKLMVKKVLVVLVVAVDPTSVLVFGCRFTLLAPDLLRTDSQENIYLQADGVLNPITVSIAVQDFGKTIMLLQDSVTLNLENGFHVLKSIQVSHHGHDPKS